MADLVVIFTMGVICGILVVPFVVHLFYYLADKGWLGKAAYEYVNPMYFLDDNYRSK